MEEIKLDENNYRVHNDRNKDLIKKSLSELGAGRSVLIDNDGYIIAGNGTYEQAKELGIPVKVVESDGSELVVVQRTDLASSDKKRKDLSVMDNATSDLSKFDFSALNKQYTVPELQDMGIPVFETTEIDSSEFFEDNPVEVEKKKKTVVCSCCGKEFEV